MKSKDKQIIEKLKEILKYERDCGIGKETYYPQRLIKLESELSALESLPDEASQPEMTHETSMIDFILELDFLTTKEFCDKYNVPLPFFTGNIKTSADQFLQIDAIKCKMIIEHAKQLGRSTPKEEVKEDTDFDKRMKEL